METDFNKNGNDSVTVVFDPGFSGLISDNSYGQIINFRSLLEQNVSVKKKKILFGLNANKIRKILVDYLAFFKGCLAWGFYISYFPNANIIGNPFVNFTEDQIKEYDYTENVSFLEENIEVFNNSIKFFQIKNIKEIDNFFETLELYTEFITLNDGFLNISNTKDLKIPANLNFNKNREEILNIINKTIEQKDLNILFEI